MLSGIIWLHGVAFSYSGLMSSEYCPTLPSVIPSLLSIEEKLQSVMAEQPQVASLCQLLMNRLKERFAFVFEKIILSAKITNIFFSSSKFKFNLK